MILSMPFDAGPRSEHDPPEPYREARTDWLDWGMRIAVFGTLLVLYLYWIWTIIQTAFAAFA